MLYHIVLKNSSIKHKLNTEVHCALQLFLSPELKQKREKKIPSFRLIS